MVHYLELVLRTEPAPGLAAPPSITRPQVRLEYFVSHPVRKNNESSSGRTFLSHIINYEHYSVVLFQNKEIFCVE